MLTSWEEISYFSNDHFIIDNFNHYGISLTMASNGYNYFNKVVYLIILNFNRSEGCVRFFITVLKKILMIHMIHKDKFLNQKLYLVDTIGKKRKLYFTNFQCKAKLLKN